MMLSLYVDRLQNMVVHNFVIGQKKKTPVTFWIHLW